MVFSRADEGVYVVLDSSRRAVAEVAKPRGTERRLALAAGTYLVKKRDGDSPLLRAFSVGGAPVGIADARLTRRPLSDAPPKGAARPRWGLLGSFAAPL